MSSEACSRLPASDGGRAEAEKCGTARDCFGEFPRCGRPGRRWDTGTVPLGYTLGHNTRSFRHFSHSWLTKGESLGHQGVAPWLPGNLQRSRHCRHEKTFPPSQSLPKRPATSRPTERGIMSHTLKTDLALFAAAFHCGRIRARSQRQLRRHPRRAARRSLTHSAGLAQGLARRSVSLSLSG